MSDEQSRPRHLSLPNVEPTHYERNLLQKVVCELRFPTLYSLDSSKPPLSFATALRKTYTEHQVANDLNLSPTGVAQAFAHVFNDKRRRLAVSLRSSAVTIESAAYRSFEEFSSQVEHVIEAAEKVIDSEFFTRVGLRYINAVPYDPGTISKWVNPTLVQALADGIYGDAMEHHARVSGTTESGGYSFTHGLGVNSGTGKREYILDFDFSQEDVEVRETKGVLARLHELEFKMFHWSIGKAALEQLGTGTAKQQRR